MASSRKTFGKDLIAFGENPNGQVSQTADSTIRNQDGLGPQEYHWNQSADGDRWNNGFQQKPVWDTAPATAARKTIPAPSSKRR